MDSPLRIKVLLVVGVPVESPPCTKLVVELEKFSLAAIVGTRVAPLPHRLIHDLTGNESVQFRTRIHLFCFRHTTFFLNLF